MATKNNGKDIYFKIDDTVRRMGKTHKGIAKEIGIPTQTYYDTINELLKNNFRYKNLIKIANHLKIDLGIRI